MKQLKTSVTNRILAMKFASEFILIYPLYTIMFAERGHVDASGIGILLATGFALSVTFEVPTGILGDKIPRKYVLIMAIISKLISFMIWLVFPFFWGYMVAAVFLALSAALESGALQAYLYGVLGKEHKAAFGKFWARVSAMVMVSYTLAYVLASVIGVKYPILIIASMAAVLAALIISFTLPKDNLTIANTELKPQIFRSAVRHIIGSKELIKLLLSAVIVVAMAEIMIEYLSLYYQQVGVVTRWVPIFMALGNVVGAILFWTLHIWEKALDRYKVWLMVLFALLFIGSFSGGVALAVMGVLVFTRFIRVLQVQFESNVQHLADDRARVTISSIGNFGATLVAAVTVAVVGSHAIDNKIVAPLRVALLVGVVVFVLLHSFLRYKNRAVVLA